MWAVEGLRLHNYLLPRDCPRVTFYAGNGTSPEDTADFLRGSESVVVIEERWVPTCRSAVLCVYEFDPGPFSVVDSTAGHYASNVSVEPVAEHRVDNIFGALIQRNVELRILPCLWQLREDVARSTLAFSIIRMRNASAPPRGFDSAYPVPQ